MYLTIPENITAASLFGYRPPNTRHTDVRIFAALVLSEPFYREQPLSPCESKLRRRACHWRSPLPSYRGTAIEYEGTCDGSASI
jgi:hypothetical protein